MLDLILELAKYLVLALVVVLGVYVVLRIGTIAVLRSISEFQRRRHQWEKQ